VYCANGIRPRQAPPRRTGAQCYCRPPLRPHAGCALLAGLLFGVALGCAGGGSRGEPLYPTPNGPLPREQVALVGGYVAAVDGHDITGHGLVEVLPGCHVVTTPKKWGSVGAMSGMTITTGRLVYAIPMKAGYRYTIDLGGGELHTPTGQIQIVAYEQDPAGNTTGEFRLAGEEDVRRCLAGVGSSL
jgi:hypothetical protein